MKNNTTIFSRVRPEMNICLHFNISLLATVKLSQQELRTWGAAFSKCKLHQK